MLIGLTFLIVLWVGGLQVLSGRITLGSFVMFNTYMGMLVWPMIALGWVVNLMQRGTASPEAHQRDSAREADDRGAARRRCTWVTCAARSSSATSRWTTAAAAR